MYQGFGLFLCLLTYPFYPCVFVHCINIAQKLHEIVTLSYSHKDSIVCFYVFFCLLYPEAIIKPIGRVLLHFFIIFMLKSRQGCKELELNLN